MWKIKLILATAAVVIGATGSPAQVMSNKTTDNPSTSGYASSATADKEQASTAKKKPSHMRIRTARATPSPRERAGATAPQGPCSVNQRDQTSLGIACPPP